MGIMENVEGRMAAKKLLQEISVIIEEEVEKLPCEHSKDVFWSSLIKHYNTKIRSEEKPKSKPEPVSVTDTNIDDLVDEIEELINDMPDAGITFAESCTETTNSIYKFFECNGHITDAQRRALENIRSGLQKWMRE